MSQHYWTVRIENTGEVFLCPSGRKLLIGMAQSGRKGIPVGCRGGGCGVCRVRILDGRFERRRMSRDQVSEDEERMGVVLACQVMPLSDIQLQIIGTKNQRRRT